MVYGDLKSTNDSLCLILCDKIKISACVYLLLANCKLYMYIYYYQKVGRLSM